MKKNNFKWFMSIFFRWYTFICRSCGYQWEADVSSSSQSCPNCRSLVTGKAQ